MNFTDIGLIAAAAIVALAAWDVARRRYAHNDLAKKLDVQERALQNALKDIVPRIEKLEAPRNADKLARGMAAAGLNR